MSGLSAQTFGFWRNIIEGGHPARTLLVDISHCNGMTPDLSMYYGDPNVSVWKAHRFPDMTPMYDETLNDFLRSVDTVFTAETPYNPWLFERAKLLGVRTVSQVNYEFLDYLVTPDMPEPDVFALPTVWHEDDIRRALPGRDVRVLPVPVDRQLIPYQHRPRLRTVLHTAGVPAMCDRNGTYVMLDAMRYVKSPVRLILRALKDMNLEMTIPSNVDVVRGSAERFWHLYGQGDMLAIPRKFGGLCLPLGEALSAGMPVLMTDLSPQNETLPRALMVPASHAYDVMTRAEIGVYEPDPQEIARRIDDLYDDPDHFGALSSWANAWAREMSWEALRPKYLDVLTG